MKWIGITAILAIAIIGVVIAFDRATTTYTHRFKTTVSVDDNGVERSGTSVIEVIWIQQPQKFLVHLPPFVANVRGDATVIHLSDGRSLVALLGPASSVEQPLGPEFRVWAASGLPDGNASIPSIQNQTGLLRLEGRNIPDFVIFDDVAKPGSAHMVKPNGSNGQLAPNLRLLAATVQITSDPVTRDIEKRLPWWSIEGRPAVVAWRAWLKGSSNGSSIEPEILFRRGMGREE